MILQQRKHIISVLLCLLCSFAWADSRAFMQAYETAEMQPQTVLAAKQAAGLQNLPVHVYLPGQMMAEPWFTEDGKIVYGVITNFLHPMQDGFLANFQDLQQRYDLSKARQRFQDGRVLNPDVGKLVPTGSLEAAHELLLIPESSNDAVMAFDLATGDLIDANFVPGNANLTTPIQAQHSPRGNITVSDQVVDLVQEFDTSGVFLGSLAPAGGVNTAIVDNMRGHNYHSNTGNLLVTVAGGANSDAIAEFDASGNYLGNFVANGDGGLDSPWGITLRANDVMVTGGSSDAVHIYDLNGTFQSSISGAQVDFPEQVTEISNGDIAVANFTGVLGISIFDAGGVFQNTVNVVTGTRGVWELGNGNLLVTNGSGVYEVDPTINVIVRTMAAGNSARFISLYAPVAGPETPKAAYLNAGQETDLVESPGTGSGRFVLNSAQTELSYEIHIRDLVGTMTGVHFHNAPAGMNGSVIRTLFSGSTSADTTLSGVWSSSDGEPLTPTLVAELLAGNIYVNVHSDSFGPGEIRGQVVDPEVPQKLLFSEFVITPTGGEMVEIHNPGSEAVDLTNYYFTDATFQNGNTYYYQIVEGGGGGGGFGDFHARFPEGAMIGPGDYQTIALAGDSAFTSVYGVGPTYELHEDGAISTPDVPDMREARPGSVNGQGSLTNSDEIIVLYYWDGLSDLVGDVDYVIYDDTSPNNNEQVDKTGIIIDGPDANSDSSGYLPDTDIGLQVPALGSGVGFSTQRTDFGEGMQTTMGGNGVTGADETSEDLDSTFTADLLPTPNAAPFMPGPDVPKAAYLNAGQETDLVESPGTGSGYFVLDGSTQMSLNYEIHIRDLVGTMTAVHFHNAPAGMNGGVVRTLFSGSTSADTTLSGVWSSSDGEPLTPALVAELLAGNIYVNVHTDSVPAGEIRGQVVDPEVPQKLLFSEFVITPTGGEMVEIHNPGSEAVDLTNYYFTDATFQNGNTYYYQIVEGGGGGGGFGDFHARFPEGAMIGPGEYQTISLAGDSAFTSVYGVGPTYELHEDGAVSTPDVPDMREARPGSVNGQGSLTNSDEIIVLYYWDGLSDLVGDVDYVIYDDTSPNNNEQVDKTGIIIDGPDANSDSSGYLPDTDIGLQVPALGSSSGSSTQRTDFSEGMQTTMGGNGVTGADETSENLDATFTADLAPTPNAGIDTGPAGNPPTNVVATGGQNVIDLTWDAPPPPGGSEFGYDDGTDEGSISIGATADGDLAVRFTPNAYPATLLAVKAFFGATADPVALVTQTYTVWEGNATGPTSVVGGGAHNFTRGAFETIDVSAQNVQITADDFFVSFYEPNDSVAVLAWDQDSPSQDRSWVNAPNLGLPWQTSGTIGAQFDNNYMIRALVAEGTGPNARIVELGADGSSRIVPMSELKSLFRAYNNSGVSYDGPTFLDGQTRPQVIEPDDDQIIRPTAPVFVEGLTGYNIYREEAGGGFSLLANVDSTMTSYSDGAVTAGVTYSYYLTAVYSDGESASSDTVSAVPIDVTEEVVDHVTGSFVGSVTNEGTIGWLNAFPPSPGNGFQFNPANAGGQRLFEGAIMVATDSFHVSDGARDETQVFDADFQFTSSIATTTNGTTTENVTSYSDALAEMPLGVDITQTTISIDEPGKDRMLIYEMDVTNNSGATITDLKLGAFFDWDVDALGAADRGKVIVDSTNTIPGVNNDNPFLIEVMELHQGAGVNSFMGVVPLSQSKFAARRIAVSQDEVYPPNMTDGGKWTFMTQNRATNPDGDGGSAQDHAQAFGLFPVTLNDGETARFGFAMVAGTNNGAIVDAARAAQQAWDDRGNNIDIVTSIDGPNAGIPLSYELKQNYPNPFNPSTSIKYALKENADVKVEIYNVLGQLVKTLVNTKQTAGFKTVVWDATNDFGKKVSSGIYIYKIRANEFVDAKKMILLK